MTYNQSQYILDALNGFVIQKTNFPFVCLVMDDASTDGEQEVIRDFLKRECAMDSAEFSEIEEANIVVVPHKTNPNCTMAVYFLKKNLYGTGKKTPLIAPWREKCKYEAMCEGDDYWIDSEKLQKQYDLMESRKDIVLCFHDVKTQTVDNYIYDDKLSENINNETSIYDLVKGNYIHTPSVFFRIIPEIFQQMGEMGLTYIGDYIQWMLLAKFGPIYKINKYMAVYRSGVGVWSSKKEIEYIPRLIVALCKMYPYFDNEIKISLDKEIFSLVEWVVRTDYVNMCEERKIMMKTNSYRIGSFLLSPLRKIKRLFRD